jgi:hypothetical protein
MPDSGRAPLIPFFARFSNPKHSHSLGKCLFCGTECVDFVPTDAGFTCHECVAVCVEIVLGQLRDSRQMQLQFGTERVA